MLRPTVIKAIPMNDYKLSLSFDNGETKIFDVKPYIKGTWFGELKNASYFMTVHPNGFILNGQTVRIFALMICIINQNSINRSTPKIV